MYFISIVSLFFVHNNFQKKCQLNLAEQKAIKSYEAKSIFLANMSHEIRTPMNGILGFTRLILKSKLDKDQTENAKIIKSSAESLLRILNDILDYSKIESGNLRIEKTPIDFLSIVNDVYRLNQGIADAKGLVFTIDVST